MNLYEVLGLTAIAAGIGAAMASLPAIHHVYLVAALAVLVGAAVGLATVLGMRRGILALRNRSETKLALLYCGMFFATLAATAGATFGMLVVARR